ncbi:GtrA family protein [Azotobacter beijerinckii]|uniref:GtrA family protein n=1 Tax=Azotobacter beijerinckii TaxID=170623 RepID=UPI000B816C6A|nr:GtrA family protein [Azotobacter beijerinckii]
MWKVDKEDSLIAKLHREAFLVGRFAVVGIAATLAHMLIAWILTELMRLPPLLANLMAFLTAFAVSFTGHYYWTFRRVGSLQRAIKRLFLISLSAFFVNTLLLATLIEGGWMSDSSAVVLAAGVVPAISFLASRFWGFKTSA